MDGPNLNLNTRLEIKPPPDILNSIQYTSKLTKKPENYFELLKKRVANGYQKINEEIAKRNRQKHEYTVANNDQIKKATKFLVNRYAELGIAKLHSITGPIDFGSEGAASAYPQLRTWSMSPYQIERSDHDTTAMVIHEMTHAQGFVGVRINSLTHDLENNRMGWLVVNRKGNFFFQLFEEYTAVINERRYIISTGQTENISQGSIIFNKGLD